jgi:hypothetical protein
MTALDWHSATTTHKTGRATLGGARQGLQNSDTEEATHGQQQSY